MSQNPPPAHVLEALETLERASEPADLGPAYQVLLDWRGEGQGSASQTLEAGIGIGVGIAVAGAALLLLRWFFPGGVPSFWVGAVIFTSLTIASEAVVKRVRARKIGPALPAPIEERIDDAIGRWRHLVPAMRELPK